MSLLMLSATTKSHLLTTLPQQFGIFFPYIFIIYRFLLFFNYGLFNVAYNISDLEYPVVKY